MKYPTTKQDSPLRIDFKIYQQIESIEIMFMKRLVVYLHCTWTVTLSLAGLKVLSVKSTLYPPLSDRCNAKIVISARVALFFFLNATHIKTIWNQCVEVYVMFEHNDAGGRAADEPKNKSVKRSIQVVLLHKRDIVTFQNIERTWRSIRKCWC